MRYFLKNSNKKLLFVGPISNNNFNNTTYHRYKALISIGLDVEIFDTYNDFGKNLFINLYNRIINKIFKLGFNIPLFFKSLNKNLLTNVINKDYNLIWIEKGLTVNRKTLLLIKKNNPKIKIIGFSPDDMFSRHNQSYNFINALKEYDYFITTKSYNVNELLNFGIEKIIFMNNGFDPKSFYPTTYTGIEFDNFDNSICFIGTFELDRSQYLYYLASNNLIINVFGNGWSKMKNKHKNLIIHNRPLYGIDFNNAIAYFKIHLCFLRKINRDLQTTRSVEIPACAGFMLAEYSIEHEFLFKRGEECDFFTSKVDLYDKVLFYLNNDTIRKNISISGYNRCIVSGYSYQERFANLNIF